MLAQFTDGKGLIWTVECLATAIAADAAEAAEAARLVRLDFLCATTGERRVAHVVPLDGETWDEVSELGGAPR